MRAIVDQATLPNEKFRAAWDAIKTDADFKQRLIAQSLLALTMRRAFEFEDLPVHGLIILAGSPGTGKTTLARGLAHKLAETLKGQTVNFIQIDAHALTGSNLGQSQKEVTKLFTETIPERAASGPLIVLLDEVETLAADRQKLSLEANPIDVHRATDAALAGADHVARHVPNALLIATTNYPGAVDGAFLSRADLVEEMGSPNEAARQAIIEEVLTLFASKWPGVKKLKQNIAAFVHASDGLDGRALRKALVAAAASTPETAQDLSKLSESQVIGALNRAQQTRKLEMVA